MHKIVLATAALAAAAATPASAGEVFVGAFAHAVDTPFTLETNEAGTDLEFGVRSDPVDALGFIGKPSLHVFASRNLDDYTDFVAAGVSWKIDVGPAYVRPGVGLALHNAPEIRVDYVAGQRTDLGSKLLFEPEVAVGIHLSERISVEASWVHISNARLFNREQNPGIDMMGLRANFAI